MAKTNPAATRGFSLVEILVTLVIVMIGLLGLLGVQVRVHQAELESYQRAQALVLMSDMVERISANRTAPQCYAITSFANGTPTFGIGNSTVPTCTAWGTVELQTRAVADMIAWDALLKGAAEGLNVGAMIGACGCVTAEDEGFLVSVAWQGVTDTAAPTEPNAAATPLQCGKNLYSSEARRRVVFTRVLIANLK